MRVVVALVMVMLTWGMLLFAATSSEIAKPKPPPPLKPDTIETIRFELKSGKAGYSKLIGDLRVKLTDPNKPLYFKVPMIGGFSRFDYIYVELISTGKNSIKLAIRKSDIYVMGYSYTYRPEQQVRARFFQFESTADKTEATKKLFTDANNKEKDMGYKGNYGEIQSRAKVGPGIEGRRKVKLGKTLEKHIDEIGNIVDSKANKQLFVKTEAELLLIAIQTVCEAVRFKYIEDKIKANFLYEFTPDFRFLDLENNWSALSKAIVTSYPDKQNFPNGVKLNDPHVLGKTETITNVTTMVQFMGLLMKVDMPSPPPPKWLMKQSVENVTVWAQ